MQPIIRLSKLCPTPVVGFSLLIVWFSGSAVCQYSAQFSSYLADKRYDFNITSSLLASTPVWGEDETNPPLSARSAMAIAGNSLRTLFADADQWHLNDVALCPVGDRWVYVVAFVEPPRGGCADCLSFGFRIVVLMDGTPVEATVSDWKPNTGTATRPTHP